MGERSPRHRAVDHRVVDPVEFQPEEQEFARGRGEPLLRVAIELRALRIGGVAGIDEARVGHQAAEQILDRLVAPHRLGELRDASGPAPVRRACRDRRPRSPCTRPRRWRDRRGRLRCRCRDRGGTGPIRAAPEVGPAARGQRRLADGRQVDGSRGPACPYGFRGSEGSAYWPLRVADQPAGWPAVKIRFTLPRPASRRSTTIDSGLDPCL